MSSIQDYSASEIQQDVAEFISNFEDYGIDDINAPANNMFESHIQAEFLDQPYNDYSETGINASANNMFESHIQAEFLDQAYNDYSETGINAPANNMFESHIQAVESINQNQYPTFHSHSSEASVLYDNTDINMSDNYGSLIQELNELPNILMSTYVNNFHVTLTTSNNMSDYQGFDANTKSYRNGSSQSSESCGGAEVTENKSPYSGSSDTTVPASSPNQAMEFSSFPFSNSSFIPEVSGSSTNTSTFQNSSPNQASASSDTIALNTNTSYCQVHSPNNKNFSTTITPVSSQLDKSCKETQLWKKGATKSLLSCLKEKKKDVQLLVSRGKVAKKVGKPLWKRVSIWLKNDQYNITETQCKLKLKSIKRDRKQTLSISLDEILRKIRSSLTPKILRI
ncbi:16145_t:CDS:10 [Funneliformis mosseae]|uniref:16145_t:CDS:1 n=1 Tax=Funneliformis mosseae TaxID=27381 RepID=A0A9N9EYB4_FUNMO|nr:16145_t:CDS:10 [Funneliformis mosseae]